MCTYLIKGFFMDVSTFTETRKNFASTMQQVIDNKEPVVITRQNHESVVMLSLSDFKSYEETAYLMQSINNATRLNSAIALLEAGEGENRELIVE
jgi:antitoxin YefM